MRSPKAIVLAIGVLTILALVAAFVAGIVTSNGAKFSPFEAGPGSDDARVACHKFVADSLRSPSTAQFGPDTSVRVEPTIPTGPRWHVIGSVDSENGFGAMLRSDYNCLARLEAGQQWVLDDLTITPR